jgi:hypothetical protein
VGAGAASPSPQISKAKVGHAVAFDKTPPLREMKPIKPSLDAPPRNIEDPGEGPVGDRRHTPDGALQQAPVTSAMPAPVLTFEGPSNEDNRRIFGGRVVPPDPVGDVGLHHYVAMVNLVFAAYSKEGALLLGPLALGTLWQGFEVEDCTDRAATRSCSTTRSPTVGS